MDQKKIGSFLKELRKEKGITQEQAAEELGVSGRTISRWETGSNMPDISLLSDIAGFYEVSIPEIIDGERKSEKMNEEVKEVAEKLTDYASEEKERILKNIRKLSIIGVCALIVFLILDETGLNGRYTALNYTAEYCRTLVYVITLITPFYATGLIGKIRRTSKTPPVPKPVLFVISAAAAFAAAVLIKMVLSGIFH